MSTLLVTVIGFLFSMAALAASDLRFYQCTASFVSEKDSDPFASPNKELDTPKVPSVIPQFSNSCYDIREPFQLVGIETGLALHFEDIGILAVRATDEAHELVGQYLLGTRYHMPRVLDITTQIESEAKNKTFILSTLPARSGQRVSQTTAGSEGGAAIEFDPSLDASGKYCDLNLLVETNIGKAVYKLSTATTFALGVPHKTILGLHPDGSGDAISMTITVDLRRIPPPPVLDGSNEEIVKKTLAVKLAKPE